MDETERDIAELKRLNKRHENALFGNGKQGLLKNVEDLLEDFYGSERRKEEGILGIVRELYERDKERQITMRNLKWLLAAFGMTSVSGLFASLRLFGLL